MYICDNISLNYSFLMINVLDKFDEEIKNAHFIFNIFFFLNHATYETVWKNMVEPGRQTTI